MPDNEVFVTNDTAAAAWLIISDYRLKAINNDNFPSQFIFYDPDESAAAKSEEFFTGKAEGNLFLFFRHYKKLLYYIKKGYIDE